MPPDSDLIRISTTAITTIALEARSSRDERETGGALFGFDAGLLGSALLTHAAGPGPMAVRKHNFFLRDREYTENQAQLAYRECCSHWTGEWHTHPKGPAGPSERDLASYVGHLNDPELGFDLFLALIVTPNDTAWETVAVHAWAISTTLIRPLDIELAPDTEVMVDALQRIPLRTCDV